MVSGCALGGGYLANISHSAVFPDFQNYQKHTLPIECHIYICQVSPQISCGDICQKLMWLKGSRLLVFLL